MPFVFPKKLVISSGLTREEMLSRIMSSIVPFDEVGLFRINRFLKKRWAESFFYGSRRENAVDIFCHLPMKHDGGGVRFNGVVVETKQGCVIAGHLRHGVWAYIFGLLWLLVLLMASVVFIVDSPEYLPICAVLLAAGLLMIFSGRKNALAVREFLADLAVCRKSSPVG